MDALIICYIEDAATCLLVDLSFELRTVLPTYSDLMRISKVWSQFRFMEMMIGKVLEQIAVDVNRHNDYAWQNARLSLAWPGLETVR